MIKLVIIEDNAIVGESLSQFFTASDRIELIGLWRSIEDFNEAGLASHAFEIMLLDINLPGMDGIQAALEQSEQDKKLLLEGMDELLVRGERPNQLLASTEPQPQEAVTTPPPPEPAEQDEIEKSESNDLSRKYKIY